MAGQVAFLVCRIVDVSNIFADVLNVNHLVKDGNLLFRNLVELSFQCCLEEATNLVARILGLLAGELIKFIVLNFVDGSLSR